MNTLSLNNIFRPVRIIISGIRLLVYITLAGYHSAYGESEIVEPAVHKLSPFEVNAFDETKRRHKEEHDKKHWQHEKKDKRNYQIYQSMLDDIISDQLPGAVLLVRKDKKEYVVSSGKAVLETDEPVTPKHLFHIGSITKTFIGVIAVQLDYEGQLDLDDPITTWLPAEITDRIPSSDQITMTQLLNHTSGIFDFFNESDAFDEALISSPFKAWTPLEVLEFVYDQPLHFTPGTAYRYSNTNYVLAGLIIDSVVGHHHSVEIRNRILEPLGMHSTFYINEEPTVGVLANSYLTFDDELINTSPWTLYYGLAHGGMVSTVRDLAKFIRSIVEDDRILNSVMRKKMFTTPAFSSYGLGIVVSKVPEGDIYGHGGAIAGFRSEMVYFAEKDLTVTVLANGWDGEPGTDSISNLVNSILIAAINEDED